MSCEKLEMLHQSFKYEKNRANLERHFLNQPIGKSRGTTLSYYWLESERIFVRKGGNLKKNLLPNPFAGLIYLSPLF